VGEDGEEGEVAVFACIRGVWYNEAKGANSMLKAVLKKGVIVPLEPLPPEWEDGSTLEVEKSESPLVDIDVWARSMNELCADSTTEDDEAMRLAIDEHRQQAKAKMRREMGLSA